jgi:hypothetical protein
MFSTRQVECIRGVLPSPSFLLRLWSGHYPFQANGFLSSDQARGRIKSRLTEPSLRRHVRDRRSLA